MFTALVAAFAVGALFFINTALMFHFIKIRKRMKAMTFLWFAHVPLVLVAFISLQRYELDALLSARAQLALWSCILFTVAWCVYTQAYFVIAMSVTLGILLSYVRSNTTSLTLDQLREAFPFSGILEDRLEAMLNKGTLLEFSVNGERAFKPSARGKTYGLVFYKIKQFLQWGVGG